MCRQNKFLFAISLLILASTQLIAAPKDDPPPIEVDAFVTNDEANAIPVKDRSVEPVRPDSDSSFTGGFGALPVSCFCEDLGCRVDRELFSDYLLQYVQVSFHADPGGACSGAAGIAANSDFGGFHANLVRLRVSENNSEAIVLTLPQPVLLKEGDELFCTSTAHPGGGTCTLTAQFGGISE